MNLRAPVYIVRVNLGNTQIFPPWPPQENQRLNQMMIPQIPPLLLHSL